MIKVSPKDKTIVQVAIGLAVIISDTVILSYYVNLLSYIFSTSLDIAVIILIYIEYAYEKYEIGEGIPYNMLKRPFIYLTIYLLILSIILWRSMNNYCLPDPVNEPLKFLFIFPLIIYAMISTYIALSLRKRSNKS